MEDPGHDSVSRFDDRVTDYVRCRPTYPMQAIDHILDGLGPADRLVAADVGAGTGISARLLGDRGVTVVAIEPGAAMRAAAATHPHVRWIAAMAEASGLAPQAVNLVVSAQSFHWFRPAAALAEFARVLKPGGRLAIMWNRPSRTDRLTSGYGQAIVEVGGDVGAARMTFDAEDVERSGVFSPAVRTAFPNSQRFDFEGLVGRARSASYVPKSAEASARLRSLLHDLHERHADQDGLVTMLYETEVFVAHVLDAAPSQAGRAVSPLSL